MTERRVALEVIAPAKLNLTLEVLGKRADGYHEIASIMQTVDLADRLRLTPGNGLTLEVRGDSAALPPDPATNLAYRAAIALREAVGGPDLGGRIVLEKLIPVSAGLGGGSSDAAAVLRGLNLFWGLAMSIEKLTQVAASLGSDVAFFLTGGTALATGRGEQIEPLPDLAPQQITLFLNSVDVPDKTRRMYGQLTPVDFSDGTHTEKAAASLGRGMPLPALAYVNAFGRHIATVAPSMAAAIAVCQDADIPVLTAGAGPSFFAPVPLAELPPGLPMELDSRWGVRAVACRTLTREESLAVREV